MLVPQELDKLTHHSWPTAIVASRLSLKIGTLFIIEYPTKAIRNTRRCIGNSFQWTMLRHSIDDVLSRRSPQSFLVGLSDGRDRRVLHVLVAGEAGCIVRALVVVARKAGGIQTIDNVSALEVLPPKMGSTVSNFFVLTEYIKWSVTSVSRVTLPERTTARESSTLVLGRCRVT
jgi:hypothetical protein